MSLSATGIIGCGAMGSALLRGLAASGEIAPADLWIYDLERRKLDDLSTELGVRPAAGPEQIFKQCRYIYVALKPQDIEKGVLEWAGFFQGAEHLLISLAAGVTIHFYEERLPAGSRVIRLMPNTPCLIGEGAIAMSVGQKVSSKDAGEVKKMLKHLGLLVPVAEEKMDAVTALSGSGPAYVYLFIEALIDAGVNAGLARDTAAALVQQTVLGATLMAREGGLHPAELRNAVTSPGGTTAAALAVLEEGAFRGNLIGAIKAAALRAGELNRE